jgi:hypothetical protein
MACRRAKAAARQFRGYKSRLDRLSTPNASKSHVKWALCAPHIRYAENNLGLFAATQFRPSQAGLTAALEP